MKTRTDFVSNSSSSSFILGKCKLFDYYGVSFVDLKDAIDALGGANFEAYSLPDEADKADAELGLSLQEWDQCVPHSSRYSHIFGLHEGANAELFENFIEAIRNAYPEACIHRGTDDELKHSSLPDNAKEVVKHVREELEVETARDILKHEDASCIFHFDDNCIWDIAGMNEDDPQKWSTESCTVYRFFECLLNKLVEMGKVKLDDNDVLCKLYPAYSENSGKTYIPNGKYDAEELVEESCLHFIAHEG